MEQSNMGKKGMKRRDFIKKAGLGGMGLGTMIMAPYRDQIEHVTSRVNRNSAPSELQVTDLRIAHVGGAAPIIRIETNQGIHGYGDVRDGADPRYALMLKSRILGMNPCNVERLFKIIKQFGYHGRQGGGVSGVEMALWDLAGKAYGGRVYQRLGGKYGDRIRGCADRPTSKDQQVFADRLQGRFA